ncbi:DNA polymerase epsilon subunit C [Scheffersomyces coipomensis]|uniref:DNA polymerase epsilon subunit C n=1 Tax=Scheffersomyces coipomensis TaxID=1788519 RepID=UPI00315D1351
MSSSPIKGSGDIQNSQESAVHETPSTTPPAPDTVSANSTPAREDTPMEEEGQDQEQDQEQEQSLSLPLAKIKRIFKMDPDYTAASQSSVYATGLATELFIQYFVEQASLLAKMDKRKKIQYKDFASAVVSHDSLNFLSETVPRTYKLADLITNQLIEIDENAVTTTEANDNDENIDPEEEVTNEVTTTTEVSSKKKKKPTQVLSKGQQTLNFSSKEPVVAPVKKAVIHDLVTNDDTAPASPVEEDDDVIMID